MIIVPATLGATYSADLSTLFDVGGIVGAIAAGFVSDYSGMPALTCTVMLHLASPVVSTFFSDNILNIIYLNIMSTAFNLSTIWSGFVID